MQIDLNGMYYILNVRADGPARGLTAEIVDEGFRGRIQTSPVHTLGDIVRLIRGYTGMKPDVETLRDLSDHLETRQDRTIETAGERQGLRNIA